MRRCLFLILLLVFVPAPARAVTSYSAMVVRIARDCASSPDITAAPVGKAASGSRSIWVVRIARPGANEDHTVRVLILCRQHGDEPASTEAALKFLDQAAAGTAPGLARQLKSVTVYLMPMVNPDGADALRRTNAKGVDLNRDWQHFSAPETRAVMRVVRAVHPQAVLDMHSWDSDDPYHSNCIEAPRIAESGVNWGAAGSLSDTLGAGIANGIRQSVGVGVDATSYGAGADTTLCHRYFVELAHTPALLFETCPGGNSGPELAQRVQLARAFIAASVSGIAGDSSLRRRLMAASPTPKAGVTSAALMGMPAAAPVTAAPSILARPYYVLAHVPKTVWIALAFYAIGVMLIRLNKPKTAPIGAVRLTAMPAGGRTDAAAARAVYLAADKPAPKPRLMSRRAP